MVKHAQDGGENRSAGSGRWVVTTMQYGAIHKTEERVQQTVISAYEKHLPSIPTRFSKKTDKSQSDNSFQSKDISSDSSSQSDRRFPQPPQCHLISAIQALSTRQLPFCPPTQRHNCSNNILDPPHSSGKYRRLEQVITTQKAQLLQPI